MKSLAEPCSSCGRRRQQRSPRSWWTIYFSLFRLILEGRLGHGGQLASAAQAKAQAARQGPPPEGSQAVANGTKPPPPPSAKPAGNGRPAQKCRLARIDSHFTFCGAVTSPWVSYVAVNTSHTAFSMSLS